MSSSIRNTRRRGVHLAAAADGSIGGNDLAGSGTETLLQISAPFTGPIWANAIHGGQIGVQYAADAAILFRAGDGSVGP